MVFRLSPQNLIGLLHRFLWTMLNQTDFGQFVARLQEIAPLAGNLQILGSRTFQVAFQPVSTAHLQQQSSIAWILAR